MSDGAARIASELPRHLAVIMDGNGRWAGRQGLPRSAGHKAGAEAARVLVTECRKLGIPHLTLYTFSEENWRRPAEEIAVLFSLLVDFLAREVPSMERESIRLRVFGEPDALPAAARAAVRHAVERTAACRAMTVNLALNYSGRGEILRAARRVARERLPEAEITEERFRQYLYSEDQPDPDLVIRTSGELRLSNYLLFQCAYSELYFTPQLWPDFTPEDLHAALIDYAGRQRRFGRAGEQLVSVEEL